MSEFGHIYARGVGFCMDGWGVGPFYITDARGKVWRFEDSDRFGPYLVLKNGDMPADPYPGERSPFWRPHWLWVRQGRQTYGDTCIWREPRPSIVRVAGRMITTVERGEPDGWDVYEDGTPVNYGRASNRPMPRDKIDLSRFFPRGAA